MTGGYHTRPEFDDFRENGSQPEIEKRNRRDLAELLMSFWPGGRNSNSDSASKRGQVRQNPQDGIDKLQNLTLRTPTRTSAAAPTRKTVAGSGVEKEDITIILVFAGNV